MASDMTDAEKITKLQAIASLLNDLEGELLSFGYDSFGDLIFRYIDSGVRFTALTRRDDGWVVDDGE